MLIRVKENGTTRSTIDGLLTASEREPAPVEMPTLLAVEPLDGYYYAQTASEATAHAFLDALEAHSIEGTLVDSLPGGRQFTQCRFIMMTTPDVVIVVFSDVDPALVEELCRQFKL